MTHIKICGITNLEDAVAAIEAGADLLGFNFYPPSPRSISPEACAAITRILERDYPEVTRIGVFVNMPSDQVQSILELCSLNYAQLHGDEPPSELTALRGAAYKAFRGVPNPGRFKEYLDQTSLPAPLCLVDAAVPGLYGGSGVTADWSGAAHLASEHSLLLAGGLNPSNVTDAVVQVKPWGVDTASGVEASPGKKDAAKMIAFVAAVRAAHQ